MKNGPLFSGWTHAEADRLDGLWMQLKAEHERLRAEVEDLATVKMLRARIEELEAETFTAELKQQNAEAEVRQLKSRQGTHGKTRGQMITEIAFLRARIEAALKQVAGMQHYADGYCLHCKIVKALRGEK